jgi:hypothetical protein
MKASIAYFTSIVIFLAFGANFVTPWNEGIIKIGVGLGCMITISNDITPK